MFSQEELDAAEKVLKDHKIRDFCCYADRGPCYWEGLEKRHPCSAKTCSVCAASPYDSRDPVWPCPPVILARKVLDSKDE